MWLVTPAPGADAMLQPPNGCGVTNVRNLFQVNDGSGSPPVARVIATCMALNVSRALTERWGFQLSCVLARQNLAGLRSEKSPSAASIDWPNQGIMSLKSVRELAFRYIRPFRPLASFQDFSRCAPKFGSPPS